VSLNELLGWIVSHGLALIVGGVILFALYRFALGMVPRVVHGLLHVQQATLEAGSDPAEERQKRALTLELVLGKLIRAGFLVAPVILVLGVFDLWPLLAGLGLVAAALTLAGQAIVLDYLMGILILVEGPYYRGDWISVQAGPGSIVEGEVDEVGLRRTTLRDGLGTLHSVSNGLIRVSSNLTRVYSIASVDIQILRPQDLDRAIAVAGRVGRELGGDQEWGARLVESPIETWVTALSLDGATIRLQRRVPPGVRLQANSELRRRLSLAFAAESIGTGRWDTPPSPVPTTVTPAEPPDPGAVPDS
jgi:moderate conductance mechanosensitive channel